MRLSVFLLVLFVAQAFSTVTYSQQKLLTIKMQGAKVIDVLNKIENESEFFFLFNQKLLDVERQVNVDVKDENIGNILTDIFEKTNVTYLIKDRQIVLTTDISSAGNDQGQQKAVTGKVTDSSGSSLPGVSAVVKGTTIGVITDNNGNFLISNIPDNAILVFSFVGMKSQEVKVDGKTSLNIVLAEETIGIEEVVAIGYGTQKRVNLTGSISRIKAEELTSVSVPTVTQAIMGKAAGVFIKNVNGQPGESKTTYNIRGFGTPLLIIDGLPASDNDFKQLDPNDIQDFSVLKDAASAAVYGSRAGNGVILVTTKRGSISDAKVTYTGNYAVQFFNVVPDFVNSEQYARMENLSNYNQGLAPIWSEDQLKKFADGTDPRYPNNNWWNETLRKYAPQKQHNINVQGGTDKVTYFVSGGFFTQEAQARSNDTKYNKYNLRSNLDITLSKKLKMGIDISLLYQDFKGPLYQMERGEKFGTMGAIFRARPYFPLSFPDPTKLPGAENAPPVQTEIDNVGYKSWNTLTGDAKLSFTYQLPFGIEAKANYRFYRLNNQQKQYEKKTPTYSYNWDTEVYSLTGYLSDPSRLYHRVSTENGLDQQYYLTWKKRYQDHNFSVLAVYELLSDDNMWFDASRIRYDFDIDYLFAGPDLDKSNGGSASEGGRMGFVSRLNYDYKGKYLVELNSRYDASPKFPRNSRWGFFPSASLGWRISEENFLKSSLPFVTNLKLRASYGKLGNDNTGNFQYLDTYSITSTYIFDETSNVLNNGMKSAAIPNPNITWEKLTTSNVGLDFNLWESLLEGSIDYFYRLRTDVLGTRIQSLPNIVGATMPQVNYAEYDNRGVELSLDHKNKIGDFDYSIGGNVSWNREKTRVIDQNAFTNDEFRRRGNNIGEWTDKYWGYKTDGLFQTKEEIANWADIDGKNNSSILPGDVKYIDYNGDGVITTDDYVKIGRGVFPKLTYGINSSLSWKNFNFNMLWQGAGLFDFNLRSSPDNTLPFYAGNTPITAMLKDSYVPEGNPWLPANTTNARWPLYRTDSYNRTHKSYTNSASDFWLINGSYIRLKTVELGYTLSNNLIKKWGIDRCKFYVSGYNLLTFSALDFMDPEIDTSPSRLFGLYYPPVGTYNIGVMLQF